MKKHFFKALTFLLFSSLIFACSEDEIGIYEENWIVDNSKEEWENNITAGIPELWETGLPVIVINTPGKKPVLYKTSWVNGASFECFNADSTINSTATTRIRLHGNSSRMCPKKSYNLDFDEKCEILDMPQHKRWILQANHYDTTMLRNSIAQWMGHRLCDFQYNPRSQFVELILNGEYLGTYQLIEHIRQSTNRVEDGYVIEFDNKFAEDDIVFKTPIKEVDVNIKDPDIEKDSPEFNHIKLIIDSVEKTLYGNDPYNATNGYFHIADRATFADFYLVNEIAKNVDARFYSSCFANLTTDDKLYMGPLWDFDIGFGNYVFENPYTINEPTGLYMHKCPWIEIMLKENEFKKIVSTHLQRYIDNEQAILDYIDEISNKIINSVILNERKWKLYSTENEEMSDDEIKEAYFATVNRLKQWLSDRFKYLATKY